MIHKKKLALGIISQAISIFAPFLVIFISSKYLTAEVSSIWILFLSTTSLLILFDFGLSPTIIRYISYVAAGAQILTKQGIAGVTLSETINHALLNRLIKDFDTLYSILAFFAIILLGGGGYFYFQLIVPVGLKEQVLYAWIVFSVGLILNIKYLYFIPLLTGLDKISATYVANVISKLIWVLMTVILIYKNYSIIGLSFCYVISVLVGRVVMHVYLNYSQNAWLRGKSEKCQNCSTLPYIYTNTWKLGVVGLGGFLINRGTTYLAGIVDSLDTAARYALSIQMFFSIMAIVNVLISQLMPMLSRARVQNDKILLRQASVRIYIFTVSCFTIAGLLFIFMNEWLLSLFKVNVHFLSEPMLLFLGAVFLLEISHSTCATIITTKNEVPFVSTAIISGIAVILLSSYFSIIFSMGIAGLILGQGIVQLSYNNWKWPLALYKDLKC